MKLVQNACRLAIILQMQFMYPHADTVVWSPPTLAGGRRKAHVVAGKDML
jgi:hypothetical protein